jgi:hypothetical protein
MTRKMTRKVLPFLVVALAMLSIGLGGSAAMAANIASAEPQPEESSLKPGLNVSYMRWDFKTLDTFDELLRDGEFTPSGTIPRAEDFSGEEPALNYVREEEQPVLTSDAAILVGAHITGFVKFHESGPHTLWVLSNDAVRISIGGETVYELDGRHADTMSADIPIVIDKPGWYPIEIRYFQRYISSALAVYWHTPSAPECKARDCPALPLAALAHTE